MFRESHFSGRRPHEAETYNSQKNVASVYTALLDFEHDRCADEQISMNYSLIFLIYDIPRFDNGVGFS